MTEKAVAEPGYTLPRMKSIERISKLPAVEQTVDLANNIYGRMKDTNNLVRVVLKTAESTVKGAVDVTLPVTAKLEGPIRVMDSFLCSGLDYVETKIPAVKLPLDEIYKNTRDSLYTIPGVKCACQAGEHGVKKAVEIAYEASQYGTQKLKDVKEILTQPPQNSDGPSLALACNRLEWACSGRLSKRRHVTHLSGLMESLDQDNHLPRHWLKGCVRGNWQSDALTALTVSGAEKENHIANHAKSE